MSETKIPFDTLVKWAIEDLPEKFREFLERVPILIEDEPTPDHWSEIGDAEEGDELYGLYVGIPITERSLDSTPTEPDRIYLFRGPLMRLSEGDADVLEDEIRITLLHEIGHHFGMSEKDLDRLGYR